MGKNDKVLRGYFRDKARFADLFNGAYFAGEQVIKATELEETTESYAEIMVTHRDDRKRVHRSRDIKMRLKSGEILKLLAVENQSQVDYVMPFRCMQYDTMEYSNQLRELRKVNKEKGDFATDAEFLCKVRRSDRLIPIYTLCLYHGEEPWDGPRSLKDMMDFGEDEDGMSRFFADYPLHLLCVNEENDFSMYHTELRQLFQAMQFRKDKKGLLHLLETNEEYQHMDLDTLEAMSVLLDVPQVWEDREKYVSCDEKEEGNMCQAIREIQEDARNEGLAQGIEQGIRALIETFGEMGLSREDALNKVKTKFFLPEEAALGYVEKHWNEKPN